MADPTPPPAAKPALDPTALLGKLADIVTGNKSPAGGGKSWISTLIIIVVALAAAAAWAWYSNRNNAELARLRHEQETQKILAEKAAAVAAISKNDAAIAAAKQQSAAIAEQLKHIAADTQAQEQVYAANLRAIDRIRSWRDVDPRAGG
jgi:flagellar basal body-associated protein FliL